MATPASVGASLLQPLDPALSDLLGETRFVSVATVSVAFADRDIPRTLPEDVALTLYRIAQESLQNVRKHSGTDTVELELTGRAAVVTLLIRDRGKGFDPSLLECSDGLGLASMTERVGCVGGTLAIRSAPGAGTEIEARVPIQPESVPA